MDGIGIPTKYDRSTNNSSSMSTVVVVCMGGVLAPCWPFRLCRRVLIEEQRLSFLVWVLLMIWHRFIDQRGWP